jgi:DMSO/TMAO reductase YedYZ heme-binding membrane subunit
LGVLHFLWLVKADVSQPTAYGLVLVGLLGARLVGRRTGRLEVRGVPKLLAGRPSARSIRDPLVSGSDG